MIINLFRNLFRNSLKIVKSHTKHTHKLVAAFKFKEYSMIVNQSLTEIGKKEMIYN